MKSLEKILSVVGLVSALAACGADNGKESCTKDSECKGDRVCDSDLGYCVDSNGGSSGSSSGGYVHPLIGTWHGTFETNGHTKKVRSYFWTEGQWGDTGEETEVCAVDDGGCFTVEGENEGTIYLKKGENGPWSHHFEVSGDIMTLLRETHIVTYTRGETCINNRKKEYSCPSPF